MARPRERPPRFTSGSRTRGLTIVTRAIYRVLPSIDSYQRGA